MQRAKAVMLIFTGLCLGACEPPDVGAPGESVLSGNGQPGMMPLDDGPPQEAPPPPPADGLAEAQKVEPPPATDGASTGDDGAQVDPPPDGTGPAPAIIPEGTKAVTLRGEVKFADYAAGAIQIDVMDGPHQGPTGNHPKVVQLARLEKPGPFELQLPAGVGDVYFNAFNDADENGRPDRTDPRGSYIDNPIKVGEKDIGEIEIFLTVEKIPPPPNGF